MSLGAIAFNHVYSSNQADRLPRLKGNTCRLAVPVASHYSLLTNYHIKLLAAIFMVIDHVGHIFFQELTPLYLIGRFSFPLFVWLLVQGEKYTRNFQRYALRLLLLAIASQPIYQLAFDAQDFNVLFTLLTGLGCLRLTRLAPALQVPIWLGGAALAELAQFNYGGYGIVMVALVGHYKPTIPWWAAWSALSGFTFLFWPDRWQALAGLAAIAFPLANHQRGPKGRWFYLFYPLHILVIWLVHRLAIA